MITAILVGIIPNVARTDLNSVMRRQSGAVSGPRVGRALVAFQVAMATTLVAGSLTLVRTLEVMRAQDPGFRRSKLIVMTLNPRMAGIKSEGIAQVFKDILQRAATLSGVEAASLAEKAPMRGIGLKASVLPAGSRVATTDVLNVSLNNVSLEHFQNIGMRLLKRRGFVPQDDNGKPRPAIVSKSFSRKFFPNVEPIGQAVGNGGVNEVTQAKYQIVGIVNDSKYRSMREIPPPTLIVRDAAWTVLPGILCGFALYAACARVLVPLLYGVTQWKAISFVGAVALVIAVTVLASEWSLWHQAGSTNGCRRIFRSVLHRPEWRRIQ